VDGFKFDVNQYIKSKTIFDTCPSCCPCFGGANSVSSFTHWVMSCSKFDEFREQFIPFVDNFFINFYIIIDYYIKFYVNKNQIIKLK